MNHRIRLFGFVAVAAVALTSSLLAARAPRPPTPIPVDYSSREGLPRLTGNYLPLHVQWHLDEQVHDVVAVFPDPLIPTRVFVATNDGLLRSTDGGKTYAPLAQATAEKIGIISNVAFQPDVPNRILIATHGHGLWSTADAGDTLQNLATKSSGLAGDDVQNIYFSPDDRTYRTLVATHGVETPGLSRSNDAGKTWQILFPEQNILQVAWVGESRHMLVESSPAKDPDSRTLYYLASVQEPWQKLLDNVFITGIAAPAGRGGTLFVATADKGLFRIAREGGVVVNAGPKEQIEWSSFGMTWGPTADSQLAYGYDPKNRGMVLFRIAELFGGETEEASTQPSEQGDVTIRTQSDGLFTGPIVLEGAHIRANSNGTCFYAAVNRTLYKTSPIVDGLAVSDVTVKPVAVAIDLAKITDAAAVLQSGLTDFNASHSVATATKDLQAKIEESGRELSAQRFAISAKVTYPKSDPPTSVTVDLSRLGQGPAVALYDDGQHEDGAAHDGVYGSSFALDFAKLRPRQGDWRGSWPGPVQLTVSAITKNQVLAGAVGSLSLSTKHESVPFLSAGAMRKISGSIVVGTIKSRKSKSPPRQISIKAPGAWSASAGSREKVDTSNQQALTFWIRSSQITDSEISLQLRDAPTYSLSTITKPVNLLAEGFVAGGKITPTKVRVTIPLSRILQDSGDFQPSLVSSLLISGVAKQPVDITIGDMEFRPDTDAAADEDSEDMP